MKGIFTLGTLLKGLKGNIKLKETSVCSNTPRPFQMNQIHVCVIAEKIQILNADYNHKTPNLCDLCHTQSENPFITQWGRKHFKSWWASSK